MSDFGENFMETASFWAQPSNQSPTTILVMEKQTDNALNLINEIFPKANLSTDHNDRSEQRSGLGQRLTSRIGFNPPTFDAENISHFALFRNSSVPSPGALISPGFSPSALLQSPMLSNSSQIIPSHLNTNYRAHQQGFNEIPTDTSINISSHESHVEPLGAPEIASFESDVAIEVINNLMKVDLPPQEEGESMSEDKEEEEKDDKEEDEDEQIVSAEAFDDGSSSSERRKFEGSNMIGATRKQKAQRVILQMECEEDNPNDGFRWRKYGRKVVKGNPNPRSYYKCTSIGCKVKKYMERGAGDAKILVIIYDGIHKHTSPPSHIRDKPCPRNQSDSQMSQKQINQTTNQLSGPFSSLGPQNDMTKLYMTGISMLPSLPVHHQNSGFIYRNEEPMVNVIPDGTRVYNGIIDQL